MGCNVGNIVGGVDGICVGAAVGDSDGGNLYNLQQVATASPHFGKTAIVIKPASPHQAGQSNMNGELGHQECWTDARLRGTVQN